MGPLNPCDFEFLKPRTQEILKPRSQESLKPRNQEAKNQETKKPFRETESPAPHYNTFLELPFNRHLLALEPSVLSRLSPELIYDVFFDIRRPLVKWNRKKNNVKEHGRPAISRNMQIQFPKRTDDILGKAKTKSQRPTENEYAHRFQHQLLSFAGGKAIETETRIDKAIVTRFVTHERKKTWQGFCEWRRHDLKG